MTTSQPKKTVQKRYVRGFLRFVRPGRSSVRSGYLPYFLNSTLNQISAYSVRFYLDLVLMSRPVTIMGFTIPPLGEAGVDEKIRVSMQCCLKALIIAHRLSTILSSDRILVLEPGE